MYEGGIREPLLVRWPGVAGPGTCDVPVISTDFYPTLLEASGGELDPGQHRDGVSLVPLLKGDAGFERGPIFWHYPHWGNQGGIPAAAVRDGDWKLIEFYWGKGMELYNLAADPGERTNLAAKHPEKVAELKARLDAFRRDTDALMPTPNPAAAEDFDKW